MGNRTELDPKDLPETECRLHARSDELHETTNRMFGVCRRCPTSRLEFGPPDTRCPNIPIHCRAQTPGA